MRKLVSASLFVLPLLLLSGCGFYEAFMRTRQIRTVAELQEVCFRVDGRRKQAGGYISMAAAQSIIREVHGGRDAWGNRFIFMSNNNHGHFSYVAISRGSDGKLEKNRDAYFTMGVENIKGAWTKDIVFRDGEAVTLAGK
jgi:hypothetical protein